MKKRSGHPPAILRKSGAHRDRKGDLTPSLDEQMEEYMTRSYAKYEGALLALSETDCTHCGGAGLNTEGLCNHCQPQSVS